MSTISRRDFMKTAGVMTLAVAASAALAGCSTEDAASSASTSAAQKTIDEINASNTYTNGQSAVFSAYGHKISASANIYEYHVDGDPSKYAAVGVLAITIAAGGESTVWNDKNFYLGSTKTSALTAGEPLTVSLDVKKTKNGVKSSFQKGDVTVYSDKTTTLAAGSDIIVFQDRDTTTMKSDILKSIVKKVKASNPASTYFNAASDIAGIAKEDIDKGGLTYFIAWNATSKVGKYEDEKIDIDFYNSNYMTASSHVNFSIPLTATRVDV